MKRLRTQVADDLLIDDAVVCMVTRLRRRFRLIKNDGLIFVGISSPHLKPDRRGRCYTHATSYGVWSYGTIIRAGAYQSSDPPRACITNPDQYQQRDHNHKVFATGDEVAITLDADGGTLRLQSPTVDITMRDLPSSIQSGCCLCRKSNASQWVCNVLIDNVQLQLLS